MCTVRMKGGAGNRTPEVKVSHNESVSFIHHKKRMKQAPNVQHEGLSVLATYVVCICFFFLLVVLSIQKAHLVAFKMIYCYEMALKNRSVFSSVCLDKVTVWIRSLFCFQWLTMCICFY